MDGTVNETLLVTGGAGFIGSNFVLTTLAEGRCRILNLDKLSYAGNLDNLASLKGDERHRFVQGDIGDRELVGSLLREHGVTAVVNFAAESHVDRSIEDPTAFALANTLGTCNLLETCRVYWRDLAEAERARFRFLQVSTDEVFGSLGAQGLFQETTPYAPNSPYAASKAAADHFVRAYHHTFAFPTLTTNCSNNYGRYQFPEKLIPLMILNALDRKKLPVYGDGANVRDWLHVEDHCAAIRLVLARGRLGRTYNVGGRNEVSNLDLVRRICGLLDAMAPSPKGSYADLVTFVADRPGHDRRYAIDATRLRDELGWTPRYDLAAGLQQTVRWYLDNRAWCDRITSGVYARERLGLPG